MLKGILKRIVIRQRKGFGLVEEEEGSSVRLLRRNLLIVDDDPLT